MTVGSNGGLEAALPEPISVLKGHKTASYPQPFHLDEREQDPNLTAIDLHAQQEALKYPCLAQVEKGERFSAPAQTQEVYAVVPADLPWATKSLTESCDTLHVVLPTWFHISAAQGSTEVLGVSAETRDPLWNYAAQNPGLQVMPIVQIDTTASQLLNDEGGPDKMAGALTDFFERSRGEKTVRGFCLDASPLTSIGADAFAALGRQMTTALVKQNLTSCVKLPSNVSKSLLIIANRFFNTVIVNGYREYWIGSAPQPLADKRWLKAHIAALQEHVSPAKLVIELGTHAVDWVSGHPRPEIQPFAKAMSAVAKREGLVEFVPSAENTRASYIDAKGLQHRLWMLDAASMHNQI
ncbi:MAG: hypothetical protein ABJQ14_01095, partial [Hyphomicrobiales bacterium]